LLRGALIGKSPPAIPGVVDSNPVGPKWAIVPRNALLDRRLRTTSTRRRLYLAPGGQSINMCHMRTVFPIAIDQPSAARSSALNRRFGGVREPDTTARAGE